MMYGISAHYKLIKRLSFWYGPALRDGQLPEYFDACVDRFYTEFPEPDDGDPPYLLAQRRAIKTDFILKDIVWASWARRRIEPGITWQEALKLNAGQWEKYLTALEKKHTDAVPPRQPGYTAVAGYSYEKLSLMDKARVWRRLAEIRQRQGTAPKRSGPPPSSAATRIVKKKKLKVGDTTPNGVVLVVDSSDSETDTASITATHGHPPPAQPAGPSNQVTVPQNPVSVTVYDSDGEKLGTATRFPVYNSDGEEIGSIAGPLTKA